MRRFLRRLVWLAAFLIVGLLAWGGYYVCNHGLSRHWRGRVSQEFRRHGLDLYYRRLTLDPIQGFVARDVQIFDANDPNRVMATIDRVALDINFTNLLHSKPFLDAVDLRNADLSLPVNPDQPNSERVKVSHLNARVIFPPHEWYVSQAAAVLYGVQVSAHGRLLNPEAFHPGDETAQRAGASGRPQMALDFLKELETVRYTSEPPQVEINFGGDLADPSSLYADATVWGENIRHGGGELRQVYAALSLRGKVIELKQCNVNDGHGEMDMTGSVNIDTGKALMQMRSTLEPVNAARLIKMGNLLEDWKFETPPELELSGSGMLGENPRWLLTGQAAAGPFTVKDTAFTGAGAEFASDGTRWYVRDSWIGNETGMAKARAMSQPGSFRAQVDSDINPNSLRALASAQVADGMRDWDFRASPRASLTVTGTSADPRCWETHGTVELGRTYMRGVPLNRGKANVDIKGLAFTYRDFTIDRDEGSATGTFSYDFAKHESWMTNVHARLNTTEVAVWIDPDLVRQLAPYRFKSAPSVSLNGFVQCATDKGTHLDIQVEAPAGMDYTFCKRDLSFPKLSGHLLIGDHRIDLTNVSGTLCGGTAQGGADITFGPDAPGYTANIQVEDMDFASITKLYFDYDTSKGLLNGRFDFGGKGDDPRTLYGQGDVRVTQGNVFAIPMLGPFSGILNTIVPGMGYNVAHDGTCAFAVRDGEINTKDFLVKGLGFSMIGDGNILFLDDRLNFHIRLNAQGLPGVLLFPVSKLLEYAGTGTLEKPNWKPVLLEGKKAAVSPLNSQALAPDRLPAPTQREAH